MGGGATGLEALRLGCEIHAVELNPVTDETIVGYLWARTVTVPIPPVGP